MVHDRARVESEVLPRYFNHASFASLRRQLNYFSFTRIGKGRQRGATYCNEAVIELNDIVLLKRRPAGTTAGPIDHQDVASEDAFERVSDESSKGQKPMPVVNAVVPFVHLPPTRKHFVEGGLQQQHKRAKKRRFFGSALPTVISPTSSSPPSEDEYAPAHPQIILDLTVPSTRSSRNDRFGWKLQPSRGSEIAMLSGDEDVLAGCDALLSFTHGVSSMRFAST